MNNEYIRYIVCQMIPNCHEIERDNLIEWILKNMILKEEL